MFALSVRLARKVPVTPTFHSSAVILGKKIRKKKFFYDFSDEMKDFDLSVHLQKTFAARHPPHWDQLKSSLIGLPANDYTLVNKMNVDSILWEEIVKFGSFDLALKYSEDGQITPDKARQGLIKILRDDWSFLSRNHFLTSNNLNFNEISNNCIYFMTMIL